MGKRMKVCGVLLAAVFAFALFVSDVLAPVPAFAVVSSTVSTSVTKRWIGPAAGPVQVEVVATTPGGEVEDDTGHVWQMIPETWVERTVELDASNGWRAEFELPTIKDIGPHQSITVPVTYTVREVPVEGYASEVAGDVYSGFAVTNTATGDTSVSVRAVWDDGDDADGIRPASVSWGLLSDGAPSGAAAEATAAGGWAHTWGGLPAFVDGAAVEYALADVEAPAGYTVSVSGDAASGYTVTYAHRPSDPGEKKPAGEEPADRPAVKPARKKAASRLPRTGDAAGIALAAAMAAPTALGVAAALRRRNR